MLDARPDIAVHRIVYDQTHGLVYFDADGSGAGGQVMFARVDPGMVLNASDFLIV